MVSLETERLVLREMERGDEAALQRNLNNLNIVKWLALVPYPYTLADAKNYVYECLVKQQKQPRESYPFRITLRGSNEVIGAFDLRKIDYFNGTAGLGYWLAEKYWHQGIMQEAAGRVIEFAFTKLGLRRLDVGAYAENTASNGLIKKLGFAYEGTKRQAIKCKATGEIHNEHRYGLLKEDWFKNRAK